jgi:hypothetical protein
LQSDLFLSAKAPIKEIDYQQFCATVTDVPFPERFGQHLNQAQLL